MASADLLSSDSTVCPVSGSNSSAECRDPSSIVDQRQPFRTQRCDVDPLTDFRGLDDQEGQGTGGCKRADDYIIRPAGFGVQERDQFIELSCDNGLKSEFNKDLLSYLISG